jgi:Flp pilus assembly protein TadD
VTKARRAAALLWPAALLAAYLGTFRRTALAPRDEPDAVDCERSSQDAAFTNDIALFERCLTRDPTNVELMTDLGAAYAASGAPGRAEATYRRALAVDPRDGDLHVRLGEILLKRGELASARAEAEAALRWRPNASAALRLLTRSSGARDAGR